MKHVAFLYVAHKHQQYADKDYAFKKVLIQSLFILILQP